MKTKLKADTLSFNIIAYIVTFIFAVACLLPFLITAIGSLMTEKELVLGISLFPKTLTLTAYKMLLAQPKTMLQAYKVTIELVVSGTVLSLLICSLAAFALQHRAFRFKTFFALFFFFTTLFSGGLISYYIWVSNSLHLRNSFLVLLLPGCVNVFNMILIRTYFKNSIPVSIEESATIDGASVFRVYWQFYMPLSKPVLATVGLFIALGYWNDWSSAMLFISNESLYPLQYYLYRMLTTMEMTNRAIQNTGLPAIDIPTEGFRLAMTMFTIGPIVLLYPFVQKYFVQGATIGSLKE